MSQAPLSSLQRLLSVALHTPEERVLAKWHQQLAEQLCQQPLCMTLQQILQAWLPDALNQSRRDSDYLDPGHPLIATLDELLSIAIGWQCEQESYLERVQEWLEYQGENPKRADREQDCQAFLRWLQLEQQRRKRLITHAQSAARGEHRLQRARRQSLLLLRECCAGQVITPVAHDLLVGPWQASIEQLLLLGHPIEPLQTLTTQLLASIQPLEDRSQRNTRLSMINQVQDALARLLHAMEHQPQERHQLLSALSREQLQIAELETVSVACRDGRDLWPEPPQLEAAQELRQQLDHLPIGGWLLERKTHRRLQRIDSEPDTLLLCDALGRPLTEITPTQAAYQIVSDQWQCLDLTPFSELRAQSRQQLEQQGQQALEQQQQAEAEAQRRQHEERERLRQQQQQALEEAQRLAAEQQQREAQAQAAAQARQQAASAEVDALRLGAWLRFGNERRQLAVKLPKTHKLVFVDRHGIQRFELHRDELITQLSDGKAHIERSGHGFDDALASVVSQLRNHRNSSD